MSEEKNTGVNTITVDLTGFFVILTIIFSVLKLTHCIEWSWLWVTSFLWLPYAIALIAFVIWSIVVIAIMIAALIFGIMKGLR